MRKIWIGSPTDLRADKQADEALAQTSDAKYWTEDGIIKVDKERWKKAQNFELEGWSQHWRGAKDDRNSHHAKGFNNYESLGKHLGSVAEIGCGPFTQLQTIAEGRTINTITLLDPLLDQYISLPNCTYKDKFLGHTPLLLCKQAEELNGIELFNTIICINVLEHVQDVSLVLERMHRSLKVGGIVIFGERCYDGLDINAVYDIGHPIRVKMAVFTKWEEQFDTLYNIVPELGDPLAQEHYFIGMKK